ncbi:ArnT family glycosyltransferase [Oleiharenicola lentus]|uniref:ArnT family glycosyltransferase n=1 Tax=Oleiharenicola lentus TaxID=2508720 RepID=UPI003F669279
MAWESNNFPGAEFRQTQTAISAYYIQHDDNFSLAYPTPVLGKPWSVPMEFPLYQWTVALVSSGTGLGLTQAGRGVSLVCFYLTLPAVFFLLGHLQVRAAHRMVALGLIVTCPLYIFYSRAFLIETMALMFSVWFLFAFVRAIEKGDRRWLLVANLMGIAAGLVKVTTFMLYLLPAGAWSLWILYGSRATLAVPGWKRFLLFVQWIASATAVPFIATLAWLHFADQTKALNPSATFLLSANLGGFNFGFDGARFSGKIWHDIWTMLRLNLLWPPVLITCGLSVIFFGRKWWRQFAVCVTTYVGILFIFPQLYAWHDYYSVASAVLLMTGMGFGLLSLIESRLPRWLVMGVISLVYIGQIYLYFDYLYQGQRGVSQGGSGLTDALRHLTKPGEVIVMAGDDWSSTIPYYSQRRALMIRNGMQNDEAYVVAGFGSLRGEKVGALILPEDRLGYPGILERAQRDLNIDPRPVMRWRGSLVYLNAATRAHVLANMRETFFHEVAWVPGSEPYVDLLNGAWYELSRLRVEQRASFQLMSPQPVRFFSTYGPGMGSRDGRTWYNANPVTRLRFALPVGAHQLTAELMMDAASYDPALAPQDMTDGVDFEIRTIEPDGTWRSIFTRVIAPREYPEDRGVQVITLDFKLDQAAEVELFVGAGIDGRDGRDWALLGPVQFK